MRGERVLPVQNQRLFKVLNLLLLVFQTLIDFVDVDLQHIVRLGVYLVQDLLLGRVLRAHSHRSIGGEYRLLFPLTT